MAEEKKFELRVGNLNEIGRKVPPYDGIPLVTGQAKFADDFSPTYTNLLHARILTSPLPHARVRHIDTSKALAMPDVRAVLTHEEAPYLYYHEYDEPYRKVIADRPRQFGDFVAAVAAESEEMAEEALKLIDVDYEELPAIFDPEEAVKPEQYARVLIQDPEEWKKAAEAYGLDPWWIDFMFPMGKPQFELGYGDLDEAFNEAEVVIKRSYKTQYQRASLRQQSCWIAEWKKEGGRIRLYVRGSFQTPFWARYNLAKMLGLKEADVRILDNLYVGNAFGAREATEWMSVIPALLAKKTGRPVRLELTREEELVAIGGRAAGYIKVKAGANRDGTMVACDAETLWDLGPYTYDPWPAVTGGSKFVDNYAGKAARWRGYLTYTNNPDTTFIRHYGEPQHIFALESLVDELAYEVRMNPLSFRLNNSRYLLPEEELDFNVRGNAMRECMLRGAEAIGWERWEHPQNKTGRKRSGLGMALANTYGYLTESVTRPLGATEGWVEIDAEGVVTIRSGQSNYGTKSTQALAKIVAEVLRVPYEDVNIIRGDTDQTARTYADYASMCTHVSGAAFKNAAEEARSILLERATSLLKTSAENLNLEDGYVFLEEQPGDRISYGEVCRATGPISIRKRTIVGHDMFGGLAAFAEAEVDTETGEVSVPRLVIAADSGKVVDPNNYEAQIMGAAGLGMGMALTEDFIIDQGVPLNPNLLEYKPPLPFDYPTEVKVILVEPAEVLDDWENTIKGIGEPAAGLPPPAIANAIYNAIGARIRELPMSPDRVLKALGKVR